MVISNGALSKVGATHFGVVAWRIKYQETNVPTSPQAVSETLNGNQILIRRHYLDRMDYPIGLGLINADGSGFTEINRTNGYIHNDIWGRDWENTGTFQVVTPTPTGINVKPTATPAASAAVCNQERRTILDHLETNYHFVIVDSPTHWSDSEIQEVCLGVIRTGEALQTFASIVSDPYPSPEAAFKAVLLFDPTDTITLKIGGVDVGPLNCRTSVASPDQASTATIDCGTDKPLNQYTMVHELGHVFEGRTTVILNGNPIVHPCYTPINTSQSINFCVEVPLPNTQNGSLGRGDNEFIFGKRAVSYTESSVEIILRRLAIDPNILNADAFSYVNPDPIGNPNGPEFFNAPIDWIRSVRGWGSTAPVTGPCDKNAQSTFIPTSFQQNPCEVFIWIQAKLAGLAFNDTENPLLQDIKLVEISEMTADLFLNWVYRTNIYVNDSGFANLDLSGNPDLTSITNLETDLPNGFPIPRNGPGDDKFYWFNSVMSRFFNYYSW